MKNLYFCFLIVDEAFCCENGIDIEKCIFEKKFVDEKAKTCTLTQVGVKKAESYFGLDNLTGESTLCERARAFGKTKFFQTRKQDAPF